jgi:hypothetical protein
VSHQNLQARLPATAVEIRLSWPIFNIELNNMQELNTHEIDEVSGGNMPESSVGGDSDMN